MRCTRRLVRAVVFIFAALCLFSPSDAEGRRALVTLKADGQQIEGELLGESDDDVTLLIAGIKRIIPRANIADMKVPKTVAEEFKERRAKLDSKDIDGRYQLARWLYEKKAYRLANDELTRLREKFPKDDRVATLAQILDEVLKKPSPPAEQKEPAPDAGVETDTDELDLDRHGLPRKRLSKEQINLIKIFEIDLTADEADRPKLFVPRKTVMKILDKYADDNLKGTRNRRRFLSAKGYEVFEKMVELAHEYPAVRGLYKDFIVRGNPVAMQTFRTRIHKNYVLNYCGTASCHGGPDARKLFLFRSRSTSQATVYTNFFILNSFRSPGQWDMIDRFEPERSLLIQYGLPRDDTNTPHPEVRGWRPRILAARRRSMLHAIADWISQLQEDRPKYGINYKIPVLPQKTGADEPTEASEPKPNEPVAN